MNLAPHAGPRPRTTRGRSERLIRCCGGPRGGGWNHGSEGTARLAIGGGHVDPRRSRARPPRGIYVCGRLRCRRGHCRCGVDSRHRLESRGTDRAPGAASSPASGLTSAARTNETSLEGDWLVRALVGTDGTSVLPASAGDRVRLTFADGAMSGNTGCNSVFGVSGPRIGSSARSAHVTTFRCRLIRVMPLAECPRGCLSKVPTRGWCQRRGWRVPVVVARSVSPRAWCSRRR